MLKPALKASLFICFVSVILFPSCKKKLTETATINLIFNYDTSNFKNKNFTVTSLTINLDRLKFNGQRKQGNDVLFESKPALSEIPVASNGSSVISYELPQGVYTQMVFDLSYNRSDTNAIITINGFHHGPKNKITPVLIQITTAAFTNSIAKNTSGGYEIIVSEKQILTAKINIPLPFWIETIGKGEFDESDDFEDDHHQWGTTIKYIDRYHNVKMYDKIINRLNSPPEITVE